MYYSFPYLFWPHVFIKKERLHGIKGMKGSWIAVLKSVNVGTVNLITAVTLEPGP